IGVREVLRAPSCAALTLRLLELEVEGAGDLPGHLRLEGEQILGTPVEAPRPEVRTRLRIDELGIHAHLWLGASYTALEDVTDTQLPPKLLDVHCFAAVGLHGVARDHEGALNTRQVSGHVLGEAVAEIVLSRVLTQVAEG